MPCIQKYPVNEETEICFPKLFPWRPNGVTFNQTMFFYNSVLATMSSSFAEAYGALVTTNRSLEKFEPNELTFYTFLTINLFIMTFPFPFLSVSANKEQGTTRKHR